MFKHKSRSINVGLPAYSLYCMGASARLLFALASALVKTLAQTLGRHDLSIYQFTPRAADIISQLRQCIENKHTVRRSSNGNIYMRG